ncbi:MAG: toxin-antitoxin system, antitoxin component [Elusimicrobia bacterium CG_4_9_14_3_um_filter_62_55]|nr:MAG: toxin-antitoxin system, antitoxin component [Elusimicrobia bacterium CG22_combo_CG10-13_8_21_14_all_63_91]PJA12331.1 MAG: toxin-antitoxin system, antitoxin component [Elusimicrobia bacterium CG_4_10_14_0_2_um_filter_63_34]PJB24717.1 MAG: toxin-antitoxin system, antitoxin component [Elusimicrobia bacterium CG_4_9_14_3_um_filter_62_55]
MAIDAQILKTLGGAKVVGRRFPRPADRIELIREGIPWPAVKYFATEYSLHQKEIADLLGISLSSVARELGSRKRLSPAASDRLFRCAKIYALAVSVFEDRDSAIHWLSRPQAALGGRTPLFMLDTTVGIEQVSNLLERIEYGVLA